MYAIRSYYGKGYEYTYEVLHELRSDLFSLYLLKQIVCDDHLITRQLIFQIYAFEMFRYMRRGEFEKRPDSASAYLIFRYMQVEGALNIDSAANKVVFNYEKFGTVITSYSIHYTKLYDMYPSRVS